jgi:threonyl-tRNA synthetase
MKILAIHADYIEFEAKKKAMKQAEEGIQEGKQRVEECLVIFTAVEKRDEGHEAGVISKYLDEIKNIAQQINCQKIVLYPYAHLSADLSKPKFAEDLMKRAQQQLQEQKYEVSRAPFGWYKAFTIANKGHPLAELSRSFSGEKTLKRESHDEPFVIERRELSEEEKVKLFTAYLHGIAVKELFPQAELGSAGFYHDQVYIDIANVKINNDHIKKIERKVHDLVKQNVSFSKGEGKLNRYQQSIADDLGENAEVYVSQGVPVVPLFVAPFGNLPVALKVLNIASAYWKNNSNNSQLARLYCVGYASEEQLAAYEKKQEEAEVRSHLKIGKEQHLFVVSDLVGAGLPLLAPNGMIIRKEIENFLWDLHKNKGYDHVWTPHIAKQELYKTSGHWDKFGDELFHVQGKVDKFVMKPMNCPHHMQIFDNFSYSYRDLPIRFFEPATIYRDEKSGQLLGLARVRAITQDDGHLFCRKSQITEEAGRIVDIVHQFYKVIGMEEYWVSLSVRGDDTSKYLGDDDVWEIAEQALEKAAKEKNLPYKVIRGEAAFYGPKLDFMFNDALGREWQLATIQCDFNLPERFDLGFMNEKSERERPVVIHRAITGALERFMAVMIEHFAGKFPLWLSPVQVKIVAVNTRNNEFAHTLAEKFTCEGLRVEVDDRTETMGKKIREAVTQKVNYVITIGDKEQESGKLAVRSRSGETKYDVDVSLFIASLVEEREKKEIK